MYDVVIIGSGVIGLACASFISQYALKTLVVEKEEDICSGTSKANSAIVHGGFDAKSGTLKAKFNVLGSKMMKELAEKLNFAYNQNGALVLCLNKEDEDSLYELYQRGLTNGVKNLEIISGEKVRELEPNISKKVVSALYCKDSAIICPFVTLSPCFTIAAAGAPICWLSIILTFETGTTDSSSGASLLYFVRSSLAIRRSIGTLRYSRSGPTGFASTFGGLSPFALKPALYSAINVLGDNPCMQEYISQRPQEEQNIVFTKIFGS